MTTNNVAKGLERKLSGISKNVTNAWEKFPSPNYFGDGPVLDPQGKLVSLNIVLYLESLFSAIFFPSVFFFLLKIGDPVFRFLFRELKTDHYCRETLVTNLLYLIVKPIKYREPKGYHEIL